MFVDSARGDLAFPGGGWTVAVLAARRDRRIAESGADFAPLWQTFRVPSAMRPSLLVAFVVTFVGAGHAGSQTFGADEPWMRLRPVVGEDSAHVVEPGETLHDVAYQHRLGFEALRRLNPEIDPWLPVAGTVVRLPTRFALPPAEPVGLVINLPEMRLYDFSESLGVRVFAVAIGDREDPTPIARFRIGTKRVDPFWRVPDSIRREDPSLPELVPPSEDNPLGSRWMTLGATSYGIHGTNVRWSIGRSATHGCVRLYDDEMQQLFERTTPGTPVQIVYEPYKWGTDGATLFLEVHPDVYGRYPDAFSAAMALPRRLGVLAGVDIDLAWETVRRAAGVPVAVGALP